MNEQEINRVIKSIHGTKDILLAELKPGPNERAIIESVMCQFAWEMRIVESGKMEIVDANI